MDIEKQQNVVKTIKDFQLRQYTVLEKIQLQLLEENKFLQENKPYLDKRFFNELSNLNTYINNYGFLITFTDKQKTTADKSCPKTTLRQGSELYVFSRDGSTIDTAPMCNIYGKNVKNSETNNTAWVDIEGYKHEYNNTSWQDRDLSCREPVLTLSPKQYNNIPSSDYPMNKKLQCMKTNINPALIYELKSLNQQFIKYLETIKGDTYTNLKVKEMIEKLKKQNISIVQKMNQDQSVDSMLQDSVVKKDMYEHQYIAWSLVTVLGISLIAHFGKKKL